MVSRGVRGVALLWANAGRLGRFVGAHRREGGEGGEVLEGKWAMKELAKPW